MKPIGCEIYTTSYRDYFDMVLGSHPCVFSKTVYLVDFSQHKLRAKKGFIMVRTKVDNRIVGTVAVKNINKVIWKYPDKKALWLT